MRNAATKQPNGTLNQRKSIWPLSEGPKVSTSSVELKTAYTRIKQSIHKANLSKAYLKEQWITL